MQNLSGIKALKHLSMIANTTVTDLGIQKFVSSVPDIESMNVSFCISLSDGAFKNIAYSCRKLTVLGLAGCTLVGICSKNSRTDLKQLLSMLILSRLAT